MEPFIRFLLFLAWFARLCTAQVSYNFYLGSWTTIPDFTTLPVFKSGTCSSFLHSSCAGTSYAQNFGYYLTATKTLSTGASKFRLTSVDGAKLWVFPVAQASSFNYQTTAPALAQDGIHVSQSLEYSLQVNSAGDYRIVLVYFNSANGGGTFSVDYRLGSASYSTLGGFTSSAGPLLTSAALGGVSWLYYANTYSNLPNYLATTQTSSGGNGTCYNFDVYGNCFPYVATGVAFGASFWATITIPVAGNWTFYLLSDDGSSLYLYDPNTPFPGFALVFNDGVKSSGAVEKSASVVLSAKTYWINVNYFQYSGTYSLLVSWSGPASSSYATKAKIPSTVLTGHPPYSKATSPVIYRVSPWKSTTLGGTDITLEGYGFGIDDGVRHPPIIWLRQSTDTTGLSCPVYRGWNDTVMKCKLPAGQGAPLLEVWQPPSAGYVFMTYLPRWPDDVYFWNWNSQSAGTVYCLAIRNDLVPSGYTWGDNWFCTANNKALIGQAYSISGPIAGMKCTNWNNPQQSANYSNAWGNVYYCVPGNSPYTPVFTCNGVIPGKACISIREGSDPYWSAGNCYMCTDLGIPYGGGLYQLYEYQTPSISTVTPLTGPTIGGTLLTITGVSFGHAPLYGVVYIGFKPCPIVPNTYNDTYLQCVLPSGEGPNIVSVVASGLGSVEQITFNYQAPILSTVTPSKYATIGNTQLVIAGANFGTTTGTVTIGSAACPVNSWADTQVTCTLASGTGQGYNLIVTTYWGVASSNNLSFSYSPPSITSIVPPNYPSIGNIPITLTGTSFGTLATGVVNIGGKLCVPSAYNHTSITCLLPNGQGLAQPITLVVNGQGLSTPKTFDYDAPVITVTPLSAGSGLNVFLTITGTSFGTSGTILVGTKVCTSTAAQYSDIRILCALPTGPGYRLPVTLNVSNQVSNVVYFSYVPNIDSIQSPNNSFPTAGNVPVTINGGSFASSLALTSVTLNGTAITNLVSTTDTTVVFTLPAGQGINLPVVVTINGLASNSKPLTYDQALITSISPTIGGSTGGYNITITGSNFAAGATATVGLANCQVQFVNTTTVICKAPAGLGPTNGVIVVVAGISSNSVNFAYRPPNITSVFPANGPIDGGVPITLTGVEFADAGTVCVGGACLAMTPLNFTTIVFALPKGQGSATILVKIATQSSNTVLFNYDPPTITSIAPTSASTTGYVSGGTNVLTIQGTNIGPNAKAYVGGAQCVVIPLLNPNSTYFPCTIPVGVGANLTVQISDITLSNSANFSYYPPQLDLVEPPNGATQGGYPITLRGSSFGLTGGVLLNGQPCSTSVGNTLYTHDKIICIAPEGQGTAKTLLVTVGGQQSNTNVTFNYDGPSITSISPPNGPTTGNTTIRLRGINFGTSASVTLATNPCAATSFGQSYSQYECTTPPGQGASNPVVITVGTQSSASFSWNYDRPTFTSISPLNGPAAGGITITINGTNFGITTPRQLTFNGNNIASTITANQITFTLPVGTGVNKAINFTVSSQTALYSGSLFSYDKPIITSVTGCLDNAPLAADCPTLGNIDVTIHGFNFGTQTTISVSIGPNNATVKTVVDNTITVGLPQLLAGGYNLPVSVTVDGQSTSQNFLSYRGPAITAGTLQAFPATADIGTLNLASNDPSTVTFGGKFFGNDTNAIQVKYGLTSPSFATKNYTCTVTSVTEDGAGVSQLKCTLQTGVGRNLHFQVFVNSVQYSLEGTDILNYPIPVILPNTLRLHIDDIGSPSVPGTKQNGEQVFFNVTHVGNNPAYLVVYYSQAGQNVAECTNVQLQAYADGVTALSCFTTFGYGSGFTFQVVANGAASVNGTDQYKYPTPPTVTQVQGCDTNVGSATASCPTIGNRLITITGTDFGQQNTTARIGGNLCTQLSFVTNQKLTCLLPAGTGISVSVTVSVGSLVSAPVYLVSYRSATITNITTTGCTQSGISITNCPRGGGTIITLSGSDFGPVTPPAIVVVGASPCAPVTMIDDTKLTCVLPAGSFTGVSVTFRQGLGNFSSVVPTVSYAQCPVGQYLAADQLACTNCSSGYYNDAEGGRDVTDCRVCSPGFYTNADGLSQCSRCPTGSAGGPYNCSSCTPGYYSNTPGLPACTLCESGKYNNVTGATDCSFCQPGFATRDQGSLACTACSPGSATAAVGDVSCSPCVAGYYAPDSNMSACLPCNAGYFFAGIAARACTPCAAGSYINAQAQSGCLPCDPGSFSNQTSLETCFLCARGYYIKDSGAQACTQCDPGYFADAEGSQVCRGCPEGKYGNTTGNSGCSLCPAGKHGPSIAAQDCVLCNPGEYGPQENLASCLPCSNGTISTTQGATECSSCPVGSYQPSSGQQGCVECPAGKYVNSIGQVVCLDCDPGYFSNTTNNTACSLCPAGSYSFKDPSASTGPTACTPCPAGSYGTSEGAIFCEICLDGYYTSTPGSQSCTRCSEGTFSTRSLDPSNSYGPTECTNCTAGYYSSSPGAIVCYPCLAGFYSGDDGATDCTPCAEGSYQGGSKATGCLPCQAGTASATPGAAQCTACKAGRYAQGTGKETCDPCEPGSYQPDEGQSGCLPCKPGHFTTEPGQGSCAECAVGTEAPDPGSENCTLCTPGKFAGSPATVQCQQCNAGTFAQDNGALQCSPCPVGTAAAANGSSTCFPCQPGTVQNVTGSGICLNCGKGFYQTATAQQTCTPCESGTFTDTVATITCQKCPPGYFSLKTIDPISGLESGAQECSPCGVGTYNGFEGQTECKPCGLGTYTNGSASLECALCPTGTFNTQTGRSICDLCVAGSYAQVPGRILCSSCQPGRFASEKGSESCDQCEIGSFTDDLNSVVCANCTAGSVAGNKESISCSLCPKGSYADTDGLGACESCPAGYYQGSEGATNCTACAPGTYQPQSRQSICLPCNEGYYASGSGAELCTSCSPGYYNPNKNQLSCEACKPGYYSDESGAKGCKTCPDRQIAPSDGQSQCLSCQDNANANGAGTVCLCDVGFAADGAKCKKCPDGAACNAKGLVYAQLAPLEGYWQQNLSFFECLQPKFCPGGSQTVQCAPHREGPLCSYCEPHYQEVIGGACTPCGTRSNAVGFFILAAIVIAFVLWLQFWILLRSGRPLIKVFKAQEKWNTEREKERQAQEDELLHQQEKVSSSASGLTGRQNRADSGASEVGNVASHVRVTNVEAARQREERRLRLKYNINRFGNVITIEGAPAPKPEFTFKLKIVLSFLQIVTNLAISLQIQWPKDFKNFVSFFDPANLNLIQVSSVSCVRDVNYYDSLLTAIVVPPIACSALVLFYLIPKYVLATGDLLERKAVRKKFWKLFLYVLFLIYPYCASTVLRTFICKDILGTYYLLADMTLVCYQGEWWKWSKVAGAMVIVYPFGIPAFFFFMLFKYRARLNEVGVRAQLGFLYDAYPRHLWWFEMADMLHKLLITSIVAFAPLSAQLPVGIAIVFTYLIVILAAKPYLRKSDDRLHLVAQTEILLLLIAGNTFYHAPIAPDDVFEKFMSFILIVMLFVFIGFFVSQGFQGIKKLHSEHTVKKRELKKREQDEFYGIVTPDDELIAEDEAVSYYKKPWLMKLVPTAMWNKWPLKKYPHLKPKLIDTGRSLLKGMDWIDRRTLQTKNLNAEGDGAVLDENVSLADNPLAHLTPEEREKLKEQTKAKKMPTIEESQRRREESQRRHEDEGAAWAGAAIGDDADIEESRLDSRIK